MQSLEEQLQHGGGVSLSFSGNFYNGYFDTAKTKFNTLGIKWRYREAGSSTWSAWTSLVLNTGFKYGTGNTYFSGNGTSLQEILLGTGFNYKKNYIFELCYNDKLSSVTYSQTVKEGEPCFDYGKDKNGNNYLNVNGNIHKNNKNIFSLIYPVGSIYMSANSTNPKNLFGGTWVAWGSGRVPVGINTSDDDFKTVEKTGGEKTHTLTENEMPKHGHPQAVINPNSEGYQAESYGYNYAESQNHVAIKLASTTKDPGWISDTLGITKGNNQAHNNLQPYITCYMWKRTA